MASWESACPIGPQIAPNCFMKRQSVDCESTPREANTKQSNGVRELLSNLRFEFPGTPRGRKGWQAGPK